MRPLNLEPTRAEKVYQEILSEIVEGRLTEHARLIQEDLARDLGVSRQPVQQALVLLRNQGFVRDAPGRGLEVAPIDIDFIRDLYEVRAVTEGLACRLAAARNAELAAKRGPKLIELGRRAERDYSVPRLIEADVKFHELLYELSGNRLIKESTQPHWLHLRRMMGDALAHHGTPKQLWDEHEKILEAVIRGDSTEAERLARSHVSNAADGFVTKLTAQRAAERRRLVEAELDKAHSA